MQKVSVSNGGTGAVPGSHLISDAEALEREGIPESDMGSIYPVLGSGDVLAIHSKTIHGGGPNRSRRNRDLLAIQFGIRGVALLHAFDGEHLTMQPISGFSRKTHALEDLAT